MRRSPPTRSRFVRGTYDEQLVVAKDGLTIRGSGAGLQIYALL